jgi:hypothetical protein
MFSLGKVINFLSEELQIKFYKQNHTIKDPAEAL